MHSKRQQVVLDWEQYTLKNNKLHDWGHDILKDKKYNMIGDRTFSKTLFDT